VHLLVLLHEFRLQRKLRGLCVGSWLPTANPTSRVTTQKSKGLNYTAEEA